MTIGCLGKVICAGNVALLVSTTAWAQPAAQPAKPYRDLFKPRELASAAPTISSSLAPEMASKCTMRIIPADPKVDPQIRIEPPARDTRHTMRIIPTPSCK